MIEKHSHLSGGKGASNDHRSLSLTSRLVTGALLTLAGTLWALAIMGHAPSLPLFCSLLLMLTGGVFIVRVIILEGATARREAYIDRRDN